MKSLSENRIISYILLIITSILLGNCSINYGNRYYDSSFNEIEELTFNSKDTIIYTGETNRLFFSIDEPYEIGNWINDNGFSMIYLLDFKYGNCIRFKDNVDILNNITSVQFSYSVPENLKPLKNVKDIMFSNCKFYVFDRMTDSTKINKYPTPENLYDNLHIFQNLEELFLSDSTLKNIPALMFELNTLKRLSLTDTKIRIISESIGKLIRLEFLYFGDNQLRAVPESIGNLKNLEILNLQFNQLRELPESIGNLKNLEILHLPNNQLKELPESIGELKNLEKLNLANNQIKDLPQSMGKLKNLKILNLKNNNFSERKKERIKKLLPNTEIIF